MAGFESNPCCGCTRCRFGSMFWPAILITLGILLLLDEFAHISFGHRTWPILLILAGAVKLLEANVPASGHVERPQLPSPPPTGTDRQV